MHFLLLLCARSSPHLGYHYTTQPTVYPTGQYAYDNPIPIQLVNDPEDELLEVQGTPPPSDPSSDPCATPRPGERFQYDTNIHPTVHQEQLSGASSLAHAFPTAMAPGAHIRTPAYLSEEELAQAVEKQKEDEDAVTMLRSKLDDSRWVLLRRCRSQRHHFGAAAVHRSSPGRRADGLSRLGAGVRSCGCKARTAGRA